MALAILGLIAAAFLGSLATAAQATFIADERATAESLARSEMEYVKSQDYLYPWDGNYQNREQEYGFVMPPGYSVEIAATPINPNTGEPLSEGQDQSIQKITVTVYHGDKLVLTVDGYKVDRYEAE